MGQIQTIIIAGLIFGAITIGMSNFMGALASDNNYGFSADVENVEYLDKSTELNEKITRVQEGLEETSYTGLDIIDVPLSMVSGAFSTLLVLLDLPGIIGSIFSGLGTMGGGMIPQWYIGVFEVIIGVIIMFSLWAVLTKREL